MPAKNASGRPLSKANHTGSDFPSALKPGSLNKVNGPRQRDAGASQRRRFDGLTRDDFRKSFAKMVALVDCLHNAGISIVDGADGSGLELVRELELYRQAGVSNGEALQTATINPARLTGMDGQSGSIAPGMTANLVLVDGDISKDLGNLRRVETVFLEEYASIVSHYDLWAV